MTRILAIAAILTLVVWALTVCIARAQTNVQGNQHTTAGTLEGSHQFTGNKMTGLSVTWHSQASRWLMIFDSQSLPANGTFNAQTPLIVCQWVQGAGNQPDGTLNFDWSAHPVIVQTGLTVALSINAAACTALTVDGNNNWFAGQMQ